MKCSVCQASCLIGLFPQFVKFHLVNSGNRQEITRKNNVVQGGKLSSFIDQTIEIAQEKESTARMRRDVFQLCQTSAILLNQPRSQGLLRFQDGDREKTLAHTVMILTLIGLKI